MLLSRVYVMKFEVCRQWFVLLSRSSTQSGGVIFWYTLHKHGTIASITPDIHQTSLHKNRTITQITPDIPQTSLHKHGMSKTNLKNNTEKIFITKDLTKTRQFIVKELNTQKRDNKIHSFWTFDGFR
jgi:hypothetical protein